MTLQVFTARIGYRDPDVLDVTRKSGSALGRSFAPSWEILTPALAGLRRGGHHADDAWEAYVPAFVAEMEASQRTAPLAWRGLLAAPRCVLVCYCANHTRCHRTLLARDVLPKLGAVYGGEITSSTAQRGLFSEQTGKAVPQDGR